MNTNQPRTDAGSTVSEGFGTMAITKSAETAISAVAATAQAMTQARFVVAMKSPRDLDAVRLKLLKECRRPGFADVARYHKPIGQGVEGPSIRFAEAAVRCMGNIDTTSQTIFDSPEQRIVKVVVMDLESNVAYSQDITIEKTVERSRVPAGEQPLSVRTNSRGVATYLIAATNDDILNKENALKSKAIRTLALRILPGDLLEEAMVAVIETQKARDKQDPDAARKNMVDAFAKVGVKPGDLKAYLAHDIDTITPPELVHLRALFAAIRDGETTWREAAEARNAKAAPADGKPAGDLKERVKAKVAEAAKGPPVAPPPPPPPSAPAMREPGDDSDALEPIDLAKAAAIEAGRA